MDEDNLREINPTRDLKLYSSGAIYGAAFLTGPIAFIYMTWKNLKELKQDRKAGQIVMFGSILTILLIGSLFLIPEETVDRIPKYLGPAIIAAIAAGLTEKLMGKTLREHKENGNHFYSFGNVAVVGLISIVPVIFLAVSISLFSTDFSYQKDLDKFTKNETETLVFYDHLNTKSDQELLKELDIAIPKWIENKEIIENAIQNGGDDEKINRQNQLLKEYSDLRIEAFKIFKKAISEDTDLYNQQLDRIHQQIEDKITELDQIE